MSEKRVMNLEKLFKLKEFMEANREAIAKERMTMNEVCLRASGNIGFVVGLSNIRSISKAMGIKFNGRNFGRKKYPISRADFLIVVESLIRLGNKLGEVDNNLKILQEQLTCQEEKGG